MPLKFYLRTFRNLIVRKRPYFAHLALTHVCNLKCSFSHIPEDKVAEQDTTGMKRIIDRLDRMGIAVLSISGGGEPLLRKDFPTLLNYAMDNGLITSNATMPIVKYRELLEFIAARAAAAPIPATGSLKILSSLETGPGWRECGGRPERTLMRLAAKRRGRRARSRDSCTIRLPGSSLRRSGWASRRCRWCCPSRLRATPAYLYKMELPR